MSAHAVLKLLNEFRKRDKCEACLEFSNFIETRLINSNIDARMLDSIYHMALKRLKPCFC